MSHSQSVRLRSPARIQLLALVVIAWCCGGTSIATAQRYLTTLGRVTELRTPEEAQGLIGGDFNGDNLADFAVYGGAQVSLNYRDAGPLQWHPGTLYVGKPIVAAAAGRCNGDRLTDIVLMTDDPPEVLVYVAKRSDKFALAWKSELPALFGNLTLADIDNDGKADIILFGKRQLGVTVMRGRGDGSFRPAAVVLPEYSFGALSVEDVNGDGIDDLIAANWVSNEIMIFTGFGKLTFSEPSVLKCSGEPRFFSTALLDSDAVKDLAVCIPDEKLSRLYRGDGFGGFQWYRDVVLNSIPERIGVADVNGDGKDDIGLLSAEEGSLTIDLNNGNGTIADSVVFSAGIMPADFLFIRDGHAGPVDAIVLETSPARALVLYGAGVDQNHQGEKSYALGLHPRGVIAADVNHDGRTDVAVANSASNSISLFINEGNGVFGGQISFRTTSPLGFLDYVSKNESVAVFLGTNPETTSTSIIEINTHGFSHSLVELPAQHEQTILSARVDHSTQYLHLMLLEHERPRTGGELIEYEQIAPARFIERSIGAAFPHPVIAAAMADCNRDGYPDIVALVREASSRTPLIYESPGDRGEKFGRPRLALSMDTSRDAPALLWIADLNHDSIPDLIINLQSPDNNLSVSLGRNDTTFSPGYFTIPSPVHVPSRGGLKILDMNGDGYDDLVLENDVTRSIEIYLGMGHGTFAPGTHLMSTLGTGGFTLDDIDNDGIPELIVTQIEPGLLKILPLEEQQ